MGFKVKVCGIRDPAILALAAGHGADFVGFVFYPPSPRALDLFEAAELARAVPEPVESVGVVVDPDERLLDGLLAHVPLDLLQLHGQETPERVAAIRERTGLRVIKALRVLDAEDLKLAAAYTDVADLLLLDAKPRPGAVLPGGNGEAFDWAVVEGFAPGLPWILAGGLDADNLAAAVQQTGADVFDVSSGVESAPGVKDPARVRAFLDRARALRSPPPAE
jgi:phosphoribosylanthranilate isomerase